MFSFLHLPLHCALPFTSKIYKTCQPEISNIPNAIQKVLLSSIHPRYQSYRKAAVNSIPITALSHSPFLYLRHISFFSSHYRPRTVSYISAPTPSRVRTPMTSMTSTSPMPMPGVMSFPDIRFLLPTIPSTMHKRQYARNEKENAIHDPECKARL